MVTSTKSRPFEAYTSASKRDGCRYELVPIRSLRPPKRHARTHSKKKLRSLADSILRFGIIAPIIADGNDIVRAGWARLQAATLAGLSDVPVVRVEHLSELELRAYSLADNKLYEVGSGWDREVLAVELEELQIVLPEIGLDLSATGFEPAEIDALFSDFERDSADPADEAPEPHDGRPLSRRGDVFVLDGHRLCVGDAREEQDYRKLMRSDRASMVFTDPPYNVRVASIVGRGRVRHEEFAHASGEMSSGEFEKFLHRSLELCARFSLDGSLHYVCMDHRHAKEMIAAGERAYDESVNTCIWVKSNGGMGALYRSQYEMVFVFRAGRAAHLNNVELGKHGRNRTNVWSYPGTNSFRKGRLDDLRDHPTVKPTALVVDAMKDCTRRDDVVLDPFCGSGTTILAAERIGRRARCLEIEPKFVDVAIRRWQRFTGCDAILEETGQTFEELLVARSDTTASSPQTTPPPSKAAR